MRPSGIFLFLLCEILRVTSWVTSVYSCIPIFENMFRWAKVLLSLVMPWCCHIHMWWPHSQLLNFKSKRSFLARGRVSSHCGCNECCWKTREIRLATGGSWPRKSWDLFAGFTYCHIWFQTFRCFETFETLTLFLLLHWRFQHWLAPIQRLRLPQCVLRGTHNDRIWS